MSENDDIATLVELTEVPQSSDIPCTMILAGKDFLHLAYEVEKPLFGRSCVLMRFEKAGAHIYGAPHDEALEGHPLAHRGLTPGKAFEVQNSPWIRTVESMHAITPTYQPELFAPFRHFIFVFRDATFECIAQGFKCLYRPGSVADVLRASWPGEGVA